MKTAAMLSLSIVAVLLAGGCGKDEPAAPSGAPGGSVTSQALAEAKARGEAVAKEILDSYGKLIDEVHALVKDKPEGTEVAPKLAALVESYRPAMEALGAKRKALAEDRNAFAPLNGYLSGNRPQAVSRGDQLLGPIVFHYRGVKPNEEVVNLLLGLPKLLDLAAG